MTTPWIELIESREQNEVASYEFSEYQWQALFACQITVLKYQDWANLKWGFNASALLEEALERQRLFFELQYTINNDIRYEDPSCCTLALRYINLPNEGLLLAVLGKIFAQSKTAAKDNALAYYLTLKSTFPYDYVLSPAISRDEFRRISGWDLLVESEKELNIIQIKRCETPVLLNQKLPYLQGLWHSGARAHEQIWRSLATSQFPILLNITLRSTILYEKDLQILWNYANDLSKLETSAHNQKALITYREWNDNLNNRRIVPWKKFFYLQVHLASNRGLDENLIRSIGTPLTLNSVEQTLPSFKVVSPPSDKMGEWGMKIRNLDITFSGSYLPVPRLSEVADLEEVFAVLQIPYSPPEKGLPGVNYINALETLSR